MFIHKMFIAVFFSCGLSGLIQAQGVPSLPIIDSHIHYSHDAWENLPPPKAVEVLRSAGLKRAFVSSSSDEGTQNLYAVAPDLIVPVLRPYRRRGETSSWVNDETVPAMLSELLEKNYYAGIGEFHAFGEQIELPVLQSVIALAKEYHIFLHAHSDSDAVERIFQHNPDAIVLWAHSGFSPADDVRVLLEKHPKLWADLAFRSDYVRSTADGNVVDKEWQVLFTDFPKRFLLGTDTFTPERWYYVKENANWSRDWLNTLPKTLAENIAYRNAEDLLAATKK